MVNYSWIVCVIAPDSIRRPSITSRDLGWDNGWNRNWCYYAKSESMKVVVEAPLSIRVLKLIVRLSVSMLHLTTMCVSPGTFTDWPRAEIINGLLRPELRLGLGTRRFPPSYL